MLERQSPRQPHTYADNGNGSKGMICANGSEACKPRVSHVQAGGQSKCFTKPAGGDARHVASSEPATANRRHNFA